MKILELQPRTTSGSSNIVKADGGESARIQLNITAASGTTPALNVLLEDSVDSGATWNTISTFAQKTAASREVISVSQPFAEILRVSWTITGASANFTFGVDLSLATRRGN
jgi:hypothetical protein